MPYKYIPTRYVNKKDYVPEETYVLIPRVTEVCNTLTCQYKAWQNDVNRVKRGEEPLEIHSQNYTTLRGTLTHYDIQTMVDNFIGVETDPLELSVVENQLLAQLDKMGELETLYDEVARGVDVFVKWTEMYNPRFIVSEQEVVHVKYDNNGMVDPTRSLKGTVDFIAEFDMDELNKTAKKEITNNGKWEIVNDKFTMMGDWKSGKNAWKIHQLQLTAYDYLLNDSGWWDQAIKNKLITSPHFLVNEYGFETRIAMCVKTGGNRPLTNYYDVGEYKEFFLAWDMFNSPKSSTYSHTQRKSTGLKRICMFCNLRDYSCPLFSFEVKGVLKK